MFTPKEKVADEMLEKGLRNIPKPKLDAEKSVAMKRSVMSQLELPVVAYIRSLVAKMNLDSYKRATLKDRIFELISSSRQKHFYISNIFAYHKKFASAFVLFIMMIGMFAFVNFSYSGVVMAETFTILDSYSGEVSVNRNGEDVEVQRGMRIYENDIISTGDDGFASIRFFDDSVGRLADGTEIIVNKLFRPSESSVESYVEISLLSGSVWARVVNLVESQSSFVVKAGGMYASARKAAFNVKVHNDDVEIGVFNHMVDVSVDGDSGNSEKIVTGQKVVASAGSNVSVQNIDEGEQQTAWVQKNLSDDKVYLIESEKRLLNAKLESVGIDANSNFNYDKSVIDEVSLFLTFDDVKKAKKELDLAEKSFVVAEANLSDPAITDDERAKAEAALNDFSDEVKKFYDFIVEVATTDPKYASELEAYVKDKILSQKKSLGLLLPGSPSYSAKTTIDDLELLAAHNDAELVGMKRDQTLSKLSDAEQLIERGGDQEAATNAVEEYKSDLGDVIDIIDSIDDSSSDLKGELAQDVAQDVKLLDNIKVVSDDDVVKIKNDLSRITGDDFSKVDVIDADSQEADDTQSSDDTQKVDDADLQRSETYDVELQGDKPLSPLLY
ncbi:MAG: FecR domain-containing protein [Candidatus Peregrinibacteria bacterium]